MRGPGPLCTWVGMGANLRMGVCHSVLANCAMGSGVERPVGLGGGGGGAWYAPVSLEGRECPTCRLPETF